jgi:CRISPR/Cas system-associated exonuclease Cas4 (RecB family)
MNSNVAMLVPNPPAIERLDRISPTLYEAAIRCTSRAAWIAGGDRALVPPNPRALLGIGVHDVLERARSGRIGGTTEEERRAEAELLFDRKMTELFATTHPLLHAKFETRERLPFYNLYRARAAQMAADSVAAGDRRMMQQPARMAGSGPSVEATLVSRDGRVSGRPDVLDPSKETVVDYKTGRPADLDIPITDSEVRQLRLYAFLANENGVTIRRGVIERADRTRAEISISPEEAAEEGRRAIAVLEEYNRHSGESFEIAASPSHDACRFCPCIPFCDAFWNRAEVEWGAECGTHAEGIVEAVDGDALVSIRLTATRGTAARGPAVITRLSRAWLTLGGADAPLPQQTVRVTDAAYVEESSDPAIFRADRVATAVWTVRNTGR